MLTKSPLLQVTMPVDSLESSVIEHGEKTISVIHLLSDTGTLLIVVPLAIMSLIGMYIFFERLFTLGQSSKIPQNFMNQIREYIKEGKIDAAKSLCSSKQSPFARMVEKGIMRIGKPLADIKTEIENVGQIELNKLEKSFPVLATISGAAPMLGFLGTVLGMVVTFHEMKVSGQAVQVDELSGGIMQALVTTVAGLIVGIFSYLAYNILATRSQRIASRMDSVTLEFMDILQEPA